MRYGKLLVPMLAVLLLFFAACSGMTSPNKIYKPSNDMVPDLLRLPPGRECCVYQGVNGSALSDYGYSDDCCYAAPDAAACFACMSEARSGYRTVVAPTRMPPPRPVAKNTLGGFLVIIFPVLFLLLMIDKMLSVAMDKRFLNKWWRIALWVIVIIAALLLFLFNVAVAPGVYI